MKSLPLQLALSANRFPLKVSLKNLPVTCSAPSLKKPRPEAPPCSYQPLSPPKNTKQKPPPLNLFSLAAQKAPPKSTTSSADTLLHNQKRTPLQRLLHILMPPVNLPLALQKHHMILHCPLKRRHVVEQGSSTWQNVQLQERPQMGVYNVVSVTT